MIRFSALQFSRENHLTLVLRYWFMFKAFDPFSLNSNYFPQTIWIINSNCILKLITNQNVADFSYFKRAWFCVQLSAHLSFFACFWFHSIFHHISFEWRDSNGPSKSDWPSMVYAICMLEFIVRHSVHLVFRARRFPRRIDHVDVWHEIDCLYA